MKRRLPIRKLLLFSLLLLPLLTAGAWVRSYFAEDDIQCLRGRYDDLRDLAKLNATDNASPEIIRVDSTYFTLASHAGDIAFVDYSHASMFDVRPVATVAYQWSWRNSPDQPLMEAEGDTGYPISGADENPLFGPDQWFRNETDHRAAYLPAGLHFWNKLGFLYDNGWYFGGRMWTIRVWHCPWWFITALSTLPLSPYLLAWQLRRRRRRTGLCRKCSYDLRAHSPGEKCPECGTIIPLPSKASSV